MAAGPLLLRGPVMGVQRGRKGPAPSTPSVLRVLQAEPPLHRQRHPLPSGTPASHLVPDDPPKQLLLGGHHRMHFTDRKATDFFLSGQLAFLLGDVCLFPWHVRK